MYYSEMEARSKYMYKYGLSVYYFCPLNCVHVHINIMSLKLLADNRERNLTRLMRPHEYEAIQMTTADYAIIWEEESADSVTSMTSTDVSTDNCTDVVSNNTDSVILEIFERKTLADYAASFKDGRHANKEKLLNMRSVTGCNVYYIVEGPCLAPTDKIGGIKYSSIEASMFNMMSNLGIFVIRTDSAEDTIRILKAKMSALANSIESGKYTIPGIPVDSKDCNISARSLLCEKIPVFTKDVVITALSSLHGISDKTATCILENISIAELMFCDDNRSRLQDIRMGPSKRRLNKNVIDYLSKLGAFDKTEIIGNMYGNTVAKLVDWGTTNIWEISYDEFIERLPNMPYGISTVGTARAAKIIRWMNFIIPQE